MEKRLAGVVQFFEKILPQAQFGSHWNKELLSRAIAWGKICQEIYSNLTTDLSSTHSSAKVLCMCKVVVVANAENSGYGHHHHKNVSLPDRDLVTEPSTCKNCGLWKQHLRSDKTLKAKSNWQKKEVASAVVSLLKDSGYNFCQMEGSVLLLISKLLLNKELSIEQQEMVREVVDKELKEEEKKALWLLVDQVQANEEHLRLLVENLREGSLTVTCDGSLLQEELKSWLEVAIRCDQLQAWMTNQLKRDGLQLNASAQSGLKLGHSLQGPNFMYRLLSVVSSEEDVGLCVINWLSLVHRDSNHDCHALLLNQWLSLFWFRSKERCFCKTVSTLLTSLVSALFEMCAVGLQCCDSGADPEPKWLVKGTNPSTGPLVLRVCSVFKVSGVTIPSLLSVDNLAHFIHLLANCTARDHYSACTHASLRSGYCKLESKNLHENPIGHYCCKIRSILHKAFTAYLSSPQGSLWAHVMQKMEALASV